MSIDYCYIDYSVYSHRTSLIENAEDGFADAKTAQYLYQAASRVADINVRLHREQFSRKNYHKFVNNWNRYKNVYLTAEREYSSVEQWYSWVFYLLWLKGF